LTSKTVLSQTVQIFIEYVHRESKNVAPNFTTYLSAFKNCFTGTHNVENLVNIQGKYGQTFGARGFLTPRVLSFR